jgi:mannose-6-phosphate isomerase-like protein (cupin superfamily)
MKTGAINFDQKFSMFEEKWSPRIIAQMNDYHFKLARIEGEFVWHSHPETDEVFIVLAGEMQIALRDQTVELRAGEMCVVPAGVEHKPIAARECRILLIEPAGTLNTGDAEGERTKRELTWI